MNKFQKFIIIIFAYVAIVKCDLFVDYCNKYNIKIPNEATRQKYRNQFFLTKSEVDSFNSRSGNSYRQCINKFAHLSIAEVLQTSLGLRYNPASQTRALTPIAKCAPIDYRKLGAVTSVKDQGMCGCCFVFSAIASIESLTLIKTKKYYLLSEEYAMSCMSNSLKILGDGCNGGQPDYIYSLNMIKGGFPTALSNPYLGYDQRVCPKNVTLIKDVAIRSYRTFVSMNEDTMACTLVSGGPMSVALFVNSSLLRYSNGIYNDVASCSPNAVLNHAVLLIGFDKEPITKVEYFIFKNSWGKDFGENGFFRMLKGKNLCGITSLVQQPLF